MSLKVIEAVSSVHLNLVKGRSLQTTLSNLTSILQIVFSRLSSVLASSGQDRWTTKNTTLWSRSVGLTRSYSSSSSAKMLLTITESLDSVTGGFNFRPTNAHRRRCETTLDPCSSSTAVHKSAMSISIPRTNGVYNQTHKGMGYEKAPEVLLEVLVCNAKTCIR